MCVYEKKKTPSYKNCVLREERRGERLLVCVLYPPFQHKETTKHVEDTTRKSCILFVTLPF